MRQPDLGNSAYYATAHARKFGHFVRQAKKLGLPIEDGEADALFAGPDGRRHFTCPLCSVSVDAALEVGAVRFKHRPWGAMIRNATADARCRPAPNWWRSGLFVGRPR